MSNPYPHVPDAIRTRLVWYDGSGHFGSRIFLLNGQSNELKSDLDALAAQISSLWGTNMKGDVSNGFSLVEVDCLDISSATGATGVWQGSVSGTSGITNLPSNAAVNIRPLINNHYRGGHPVTHHPPPTTSQQNGSRNWSSTYCSGVATHWNTMMVALEGFTHGTVVAPVQVVLLGYKPGGAASDVTPATPNGYLVPTKVGTMRRRLSTES